MNKKTKIIIEMVVILVLTIILHFLLCLSESCEFYAVPVNEGLNSLKPVDKSCVVDEDCKMAQTDCSVCGWDSKGAAVNKNYNAFCPIPTISIMGACPASMPCWYGIEVSCANNTCVDKEGGGEFGCECLTEEILCDAEDGTWNAQECSCTYK